MGVPSFLLKSTLSSVLICFGTFRTSFSRNPDWWSEVHLSGLESLLLVKTLPLIHILHDCKSRSELKVGSDDKSKPGPCDLSVYGWSRSSVRRDLDTHQTPGPVHTLRQGKLVVVLESVCLFGTVDLNDDCRLVREVDCHFQWRT